MKMPRKNRWFGVPDGSVYYYVISKPFLESAISYGRSHKEKRIRCQGYIINLVVMAFFFGPHPNEGFDVYDGPTFEEAEKWRKLGPMGKLHNIIIFIQKSPQRK